MCFVPVLPRVWRKEEDKKGAGNQPVHVLRNFSGFTILFARSLVFLVLLSVLSSRRSIGTYVSLHIKESILLFVLSTLKNCADNVGSRLTKFESWDWSLLVRKLRVFADKTRVNQFHHWTPSTDPCIDLFRWGIEIVPLYTRYTLLISNFLGKWR